MSFMPPRGPYAKGVAKRREILDAALDIVDRHGYSAATVEELAAAVDLSPNGLLHYFGSKAALFTQILEHFDEGSLAAANQAFAEGRGPTSFESAMVDMTRIGDRVPGFGELYLSLCAEAMQPTHHAHPYFIERYATQRRLVAPSFANLQRAGRVRADADPDMLASMVFALIDGLQTQRAFEPTLDVPAHIQHFFDLIAP